MLEFVVAIIDSRDREWILGVTANEEVAAAQSALAELQTRLAELTDAGLTIPKPGSTIYMLAAGELRRNPYEIPPKTWAEWPQVAE